MLEIKNLHFSYNDQTPVLNNLSLNIEDGDFIALVGPNGCGKTTLIKLICDLLKKQKGTIELNGIENSNYTVKTSILYLPSEDILPEFLTGLEYVKLMLKMYGIQLDEKQLSSLSKFYSFESALDVMIEEYSHGMRKKIQFISAMLINPELLIIDETLNGMDVESREITKILLEKYSSKGKTIVMCSHDLNLLEEVCSKAIVLYNGRIHISKKMEDIKKETDLISIFREILNHEELKNKILTSEL